MENLSRGVRPASGVPGECFSLKDRVDDAIDPTDEDDYVFDITEEELEAEEDDGDGDYDGGKWIDSLIMITSS